MIKNISFGHYKAFEKGDIEIRPLTFLLGANSVGKSSILQLILSLQQTALCDANYRSALKLNGGYVTLGENVNLFRKKDINSPINIKITFENEDIYSSLKEGYLDNYIEEIVTFSASIDRTVVFEDGITMAKMNQEEEGIFAILKKAFNFSTKKEIDIHDYLFHISNKTSKIDKKIFYQIIETIAKKLADKSIKKKDVDENYFFYRSRSFNYFTISERKDEFLLCYDYLSELSENISSKLFSINFELKSKERSDILFISKVSFYNENFEILSLEFERVHSKLSLRQPERMRL